MKYPFMQCYLQATGSMPYYIEDQIEKATKDNAPRTAMYKREDKWITIEEFSDSALRASIYYMVAKMEKDSK